MKQIGMNGREGVVAFTGFAGRHELRVVVIGETKTKYRVSYLQAGRVAGRNKSVAVGDEMLVPKRALRFDNIFAKPGESDP